MTFSNVGNSGEPTGIIALVTSKMANLNPSATITPNDEVYFLHSLSLCLAQGFFF